MKKIISVLLICLLACGLFAGCGNRNKIPEDAYVWNYAGRYIGYTSDGYFWHYQGECIGALKGNEVYNTSGSYIGEIRKTKEYLEIANSEAFEYDGYRICVDNVKRTKTIPSFNKPYKRYAQYNSYARYAYTPPSGCSDFTY